MDVAKVVATLEQNHHLRWWPDELKGAKLTMNRLSWTTLVDNVIR